MSTVIPTLPTIPDTLEMSDGQVISASDWEDLVEYANWEFVYAPITIGGQAFSADFQTTSTSYTTENEAGTNARDLNHVSLVGRMLRLLDQDRYRWELSVFGEEVDVRVTVYRDDEGTRTSLGTFDLSITASSKEWAKTTITLSQPDTLVGGTAGNDAEVLACEVEAKTNATSGEIEMWHIKATRISDTADLPGGVVPTVNYYDDVVTKVSSNVKWHYRFDETSISDGTTCTDATGTYDATYNLSDGSSTASSVPTLVSAGEGTAVDVDLASVDEIAVPSSGAELVDNNQATIGFAIKNATEGRIYYEREDTDNRTIIEWTASDTIRVDHSVTNVDGVTDDRILESGTLTPSSVTWVHFVIDSTALRLYINGSEVSSPSKPDGSGSPTVLFIMPGAFGVDGVIDEMTMHNISLTASEIQALYDGGTGGPYP